MLEHITVNKLSAFATIRADEWQERMRHVLETIVRTPAAHARWLNTLSLLEHIGSRKIIKALDSTFIDETILRHIAEEARHAHIFKRLSLRVVEGLCDSYEAHLLFCGEAATRYFQALDNGVASYLDETLGQHNVELNYLCVTTLVELRATALYEIYERVLKKTSSALSLRSVLAEEDKHLDDMKHAFKQRQFSWAKYETELLAIEERLFLELLEQLEHTLMAAA